MATAVYTVNSSIDDVQETGGVMSTSGVRLRVNATNVWILARWTGVFSGVAEQVRATHVTSATLAFYIPGTIDSPDIDFWGDDSDSAAEATDDANNINTRTKTAATASWTGTDIGTGYKDVDVTDIVKEIVDRAGWANGNPIAIFGQGQTGGDVQIVSYDGTDTQAPRLTIVYDPPAVAAATGAATSAATVSGYGTGFGEAAGEAVSNAEISAVAVSGVEATGEAVSGAGEVDGFVTAYAVAAGASASDAIAEGFASATGSAAGAETSAGEAAGWADVWGEAAGAATSDAACTGARLEFGEALGAAVSGAAASGFGTAFGVAVGAAASAAEALWSRGRRVKPVNGPVAVLVPPRVSIMPLAAVLMPARRG